jgi:hypothetical protein
VEWAHFLKARVKRELFYSERTRAPLVPLQARASRYGPGVAVHAFLASQKPRVVHHSPSTSPREGAGRLEPSFSCPRFPHPTGAATSNSRPSQLLAPVPEWLRARGDRPGVLGKHQLAALTSSPTPQIIPFTPQGTPSIPRFRGPRPVLVDVTRLDSLPALARAIHGAIRFFSPVSRLPLPRLTAP